MYTIQVPIEKHQTFDIETYINYFLILFVNAKTLNVEMYAEIRNGKYYLNSKPMSYNSTIAPIMRLMENDDIVKVSFNGTGYDQLLYNGFINGFSNVELKHLSDHIITGRLQWWHYQREYGYYLDSFNHIDLMPVVLGQKSLKEYGAIMGSKLLKELPIAHNAFLMPCQMDDIRDYCINDNLVTVDLLNNQWNDIYGIRVPMSKRFDIDLRSRGSAKIVQMVFENQHKTLTGKNLTAPKNVPKKYRYIAPEYMEFEGEEYHELLYMATSVEFKVSKSHKLLLPKEMGAKFFIGEKEYKFGLGGLHSQNDRGFHKAGNGYDIIELDFSSYYPNIIRALGIFPSHIDKEVFDAIYLQWLADKGHYSAKLKDEKLNLSEDKKAEYATIIKGVKLLLNAFFGVTGLHYAKVLSYQTLLQTTITGQLSIFMIIEQLNKQDIQILSSNTDSVTVKVHNDDKGILVKIVDWFQDLTDYVIDYTYYDQICYRDVNSYFYKMPDGYVGGKGAHAADAIDINPSNRIIRDAHLALIKDGTSIEETIYNADNILDFLNVAKSSEGALKVYDDGSIEHLGKIVRFYKSTKTNTPINKSKSGNTVPLSQCAIPLANIPDGNICPDDLDREWYVQQAYLDLVMMGYFDDRDDLVIDMFGKIYVFNNEIHEGVGRPITTKEVKEMFKL